MTARLRTLCIDADRVVLVLDRVNFTPTTEQVAALTDIAKRCGATGMITFAWDVDIPEVDPQPEVGENALRMYADEIEAIRWAHNRLTEIPVGASDGELPPTAATERHLRALHDLRARTQALFR